ncbi:MAG: flavodoxin family protein [Pseudomonadota bacterium]
MKALILSSSPRRDGNSACLAGMAAEGLEDAGHRATLLQSADVLAAFLRDCRSCRNSKGECSIDDGYRDLFFDHFLPADGLIVATPIYWYGMSAQLKAFFDRMFCYVAVSHPRSSSTVAAMQGKRLGLVLSSEETFPSVSAAIIHQIQEYSRYTGSTFVGVVHSYGNVRGEVSRDPSDPIHAAKQFGRSFFDAHATDYRIDTARPAAVWGDRQLGRCHG